jgi:hypothetical protein
LIYGLVQSGKTGVLTVTGAMGADEGYRTIIILTSDNDPLYEQTLGRAQEAFPGIDIIGKKDFKDVDSFLQRIKGGTCAIVTTKNSGLLRTLIENFKQGKVRGLTCLIIDDEADQASLNTKERRADGTKSAINDRIVELRTFFEKNTYLQVTATPQALFLQTPGHDFRPKFTVLSHPGSDYVGGEDFFGDDSKLVREFDLNDITVLAPGPQPTPMMEIPASLLRALDTFMVGATFKRTKDADQNCAFLCQEVHMALVKNVEKQIWDIEGFDVVIKHSDGRDMRGDKHGIPSYQQDRTAKNVMTVNEWKQKRFAPKYAGLDVDVLDGTGAVVTGNTLLSTVRDSYSEE